ncbi:MAG: hypothetical protein ACR2JK_19375 [Geodermatophilaceae bacterium]
MSEDDAASVSANEPESDSALLAAARQLCEEAALWPRLAGLTGVRRRAAVNRNRRAACR